LAFRQSPFIIFSGNFLHAYSWHFLACPECHTRIKARVDAGQSPALSDVWQLNPLYSDTQLFGQYVSQVFYKVLEK
jgi:hypothetical protein